MYLCHLYNQTSSYKNIQKLYDSFEEYVALDIDTITNLDEYDVFIIELQDADQEISKKLVSLFKHKTHSLIYFIIPKNHTLLLFQLTYLLRTKSIITQNQDIDKLIQKIHTDKEEFAHNSFVTWIGNTTLQTQNSLLYRNNKLFYVSHTLLESFNCTTHDIFYTNVLSKLNIEQLLQSDTTLNIDIINPLGAKQKYICRSHTIPNKDKIIYMDIDISVKKEFDFITSRVSFIELLKEKLLQSTLPEEHLSIVTINIENIKNLSLDLGIVELENLLLDTLSFINSISDNKLLLSQLEQGFYVILFEDINIDEFNLFIKNFNVKLSTYINTKKTKILFKMFMFYLDDLEFSNILKSIDDIKNQNFISYKKNTKYIKEIKNSASSVDEKGMLSNAFEEDVTFKLLNIYNGLIINTKSKIFKITKDNIYINFTQLQGVVLNIEKKTVLQSSTFGNDIEADVKQINLQKQIAILENFKFLNTNANARKYARVTPLKNIPIAINLDTKTVNGNILDLSIKSIAIRVKYIKTIGFVELRKVSLIFNILDKDSENGYIQLNLKANVVVVTPKDKHDYYKVICDLSQESHDIDILLKYVYERQKELIIELKKMSKLN